MNKTTPLTESRTHYLYHRYGLDVPPFVDTTTRAASGTVLIIDPGDTFYFVSLQLMLPDCRLILCRRQEDAGELFLHNPVDIVLLHHSARYPALDLLRRFKTERPSVPVLLMAEQGSEALAIDAFRGGARDYFRKPLSLDEVERTLKAMLTMRGAPPLPHLSAIAEKGFETALQHIHFYFNKPLSLPLVAEKSGMSLSSFIRLFKRKTGMTFVDYLNSVRMAAACRLLKDPELSLLRISMVCGYNNQSHFNRVFKKFVGMAPGVYKKNLARARRVESTSR